jgi:hypothetical protein
MDTFSEITVTWTDEETSAKVEALKQIEPSRNDDV